MHIAKKQFRYGGRTFDKGNRANIHKNHVRLLKAVGWIEDEPETEVNATPVSNPAMPKPTPTPVVEPTPPPVETPVVAEQPEVAEPVAAAEHVTETAPEVAIDTAVAMDTSGDATAPKRYRNRRMSSEEE